MWLMVNVWFVSMEEEEEEEVLTFYTCDTLVCSKRKFVRQKKRRETTQEERRRVKEQTGRETHVHMHRHTHTRALTYRVEPTDRFTGSVSDRNATCSKSEKNKPQRL